MYARLELWVGIDPNISFFIILIFRIVERALQKGSLVLQKICTNWLMEAQLPQNTQWFIKLQIGDAEASTRSRHSINSTLNCSLNSTTYSVLNNDLNSTFIISKRESDYSRRLVLPAVLDQDCAPSAFGGSNELLHIVGEPSIFELFFDYFKILDIGRKVNYRISTSSC